MSEAWWCAEVRRRVRQLRMEQDYERRKALWIINGGPLPRDEKELDNMIVAQARIVYPQRSGGVGRPEG